MPVAASVIGAGGFGGGTFTGSGGGVTGFFAVGPEHAASATTIAMYIRITPTIPVLRWAVLYEPLPFRCGAVMPNRIALAADQGG
jgi:hypothetical protein